MTAVTENGHDRWKRPAHVPYPSVWSRFEGRKVIDGVLPKFWTQDIPENQIDTVVDYMVNEFRRDEPICKYSDMKSDPTSSVEMRVLWQNILKDKLGLICYMENPDPLGDPIIAGMNCTHLKSRLDPNFAPEGETMKMVMKTFAILSSFKNEFDALGTNELLSALGLFVLPRFRGQNIGIELLKAREPLCKAVGIKATITAFTAANSQALAERDNFKLLSEISYENLQKMDPTIKYPGIEQAAKMLKYMYKMY